MTPFTIRPAAPADANLLAELGARLFEDTFGPDNDPADMRAYLAEAFTSERMAEELADPTREVWLARDTAEVPIGYAVVWANSTPAVPDSRNPLEIVRIYADRGWQGRGLGPALMETCLSHARERQADLIWLGVWERNPRAIAFYQRCGFAEVGTQVFRLGRDVQRDLILARAP